MCCSQEKNYPPPANTNTIGLITSVLLAGIQGANAIFRRRKELLPPETFTESDSYVSNISISTVALALLGVIVGGLIMMDAMVIKEHISQLIIENIKGFYRYHRRKIHSQTGAKSHPLQI